MSFYRDILDKAALRASVEFRRLVTVESLKDNSKSISITHPRHFAIAYMHAIGRHSMPQIARAFGRQDHTTILSSLRRAHGHDGGGFQLRNGERQPIEPLWKKEQFENMVRLDGWTGGPVVSADAETIQAVGEQNLTRFVSGKGWEAAA